MKTLVENTLVERAGGPILKNEGKRKKRIMTNNASIVMKVIQINESIKMG